MKILKKSSIISFAALVVVGVLLAQNKTKDYSYAGYNGYDVSQVSEQDGSADNAEDKQLDNGDMLPEDIDNNTGDTEDIDTDSNTGEKTDDNADNDTGEKTDDNADSDTGDTEGVDVDNNLNDKADDDKENNTEGSITNENPSSDIDNSDENKDKADGKSIQSIDSKDFTLKNSKALASGSVQKGFFTGIRLVDTKSQSDIASIKDVKRGTDIRLEYNYEVPSGGMAVNTNYTFSFPKEIYVEDGQRITIKLDGEVVAEGSVTYNSMSEKNDVVFYFKDTQKGAEATQPGTAGDMWIVGELSKDRIDNKGKQTIDFQLGLADNSDKIGVDFAIDKNEANVVLTKKCKSHDLTNKTITWEIEVDLSTTPANLPITELVITDTLLNNKLNFNSLDLTGYSCVDKGGNVVGGNINYDDSSKKITYEFPSGYEANTNNDKSRYTLILVTPFSLDAFSGSSDKINFENKAKASYSFVEIPGNKDSSGNFVENTAAVTKQTKESKADITLSGGLLDKKGVLAIGGAREIDWTVTINKNKFGIDNAVINDTVSDGLAIDESSIKAIDSSNTSVPINNSDKVSSDKKRLRLEFGSITDSVTITYKTKVADEFYEDNKSETFKNNVEFTGGIPGFSISKSANVKISNSLIAKSGSYNRKNHTITWTVTLNQHSSTLRDLKVTDIIPGGLTIVTKGSSFSPQQDIKLVSGAADKISFAYDNNTKKITADISGEISDTYKFSFDTTVDDNNIWAVNDYKKSPFTNTAMVTIGSGSAASEYSAASTPEIISELFKKTAVTYDNSKNEIEWQLEINHNEMTITNGRIEDIISDGQEYVDGSFKIKTPAGSSELSAIYNSGAKRLTVSFSEKINNKYIATFRTKITDTQFLFSNETKTFFNSAILYGAEFPKPIESSASKEVKGSVISKSGSVKKDSTGSSYLEWEVIINKNKAELDKPVIVDELSQSPMLELDPSSVRLYKIDVSADGTIAQKGQVSITAENVSYNSATGVFKFKFLDKINEAYKLVFRTDYGDDAVGKSIGNKVYYEGSNADEVEDSTAVAISNSSAGGSTSIKKGTVKITKTKEGSPQTVLEGAVFKLSNSYFSMTSEPTDKNGIAVFENIRAGSYKLKEITAPIGYNLSSMEKDIQIVNADQIIELYYENTQIKGELNLKIYDLGTERFENGVAVYDPFEGIEVDVYDKNDIFIKTETTGRSGEISMELSYGVYYYKVKTVPDGYIHTEDKYPFEIKKDGDKVNRELTISPTYTTVTISVVDNDGNPIKDVTVKLYDELDKLLDTLVTNENGELKFVGLRKGKYYFKQVSGPDGYIIDPDIFEFEVGGDNQSYQITAENTVIKGSAEITKFDSTQYTQDSLSGKAYTKTLSGAVIGIYSNGNKLYEVTTDSFGKAFLSELKYGSYTYKELTAPEGYKLNENEYTFDIKENGETIYLTLLNDPVNDSDNDDNSSEGDDGKEDNDTQDGDDKIISGDRNKNNKEIKDIRLEENEASVSENTAKSQLSLLPKTGEGSRIPLYIIGVCLIISGAGLFTVSCRIKKRNED